MESYEIVREVCVILGPFSCCISWHLYLYSRFLCPPAFRYKEPARHLGSSCVVREGRGKFTCATTRVSCMPLPSETPRWCRRCLSLPWSPTSFSLIPSCLLTSQSCPDRTAMWNAHAMWRCDRDQKACASIVLVCGSSPSPSTLLRPSKVFTRGHHSHARSKAPANGEYALLTPWGISYDKHSSWSWYR
jgi:hypothetical protein